jgi:hypothetical protein
MKNGRFSDAQIIAVLKQAEAIVAGQRHQNRPMHTYLGQGQFAL